MQQEKSIGLSKEHRDYLKSQGLSDKVIEVRPYLTLNEEIRVQLEKRWGFAACQLEGEGIIIPRYRPTGEEAPPQVRHFVPRQGPDGRYCKYDSPKGSGGIIDVHPLVRDAVMETSVPLWIPESIKGEDALVSRGYAAVGFQGVWGWSYEGRLSLETGH